MYTIVQSKDKAPPGNRVGPYYSSVIFFYSVEELHLSINTFCTSPNGVHLRELTVVCATPQYRYCIKKKWVIK